MLNNTQAVLRAKREFLRQGHVQQGAVAETIERSWRRCLDEGVDTSVPAHDFVITQHELTQIREASQHLLAQARPEMETLNEQLSHTRSLVILTDHQGVVLHTLGDQRFLQDTHRISMRPGSLWGESQRGTNAIGTALVEKVGLSVRGAEHFMDFHHVLSCSAVPIFGASNELLGTLDVTNDFAVPQQHTLSLVKMAAQTIENRLFQAGHAGEILLHFHARPEFVGTLWEGIAMFSRDGQLLALNRSAQFQFELGVDPQTLHFDALFDVPLKSALAGRGDGLIMPLRLANGARIYARIESRVPAMPASGSPVVPGARRESAATLEMLDSGDQRVARAISQIRLVLDRDIPILVEGETGVGKELFARAIHEASNRRRGPWVAVNCAALPEGLIEAELFGYEEGAFTGARRKGSAGKLEQANGGTLFLDEIGDMPLSLQARLLRVLQERSVTPLGSSKAKPLDFALVSATNQKLREKVESGEFRRDLYYRLNGLQVQLPALRDRTDIDNLLQLILHIEHATNVRIDDTVVDMFKAHPWPGNVRQMHNVLRTALALAGGDRVTDLHLPQDFLDEMTAVPQEHASTLSLDHLEADAVRVALQQNAGNVSATARQLGISRNTLYRKLKVLGLV